jgi:hypothetical protein
LRDSNNKSIFRPENLWAADYEFTPDELSKFTEEVSKIKIVGDRYTGAQAEQTKK